MQPENNSASKKKNSKAEASPTKIDWSKWGKTVRVSWETYDSIIKHGKFGESFDDVLKRLLNGG